MSAPDRLKAGLGKSPMQNLSLIHQVFDCPDNILEFDRLLG